MERPVYACAAGCDGVSSVVEARVGIKKANGKNRGRAKESVRESTVQTKKPVDVVQARENVAALVRDSGSEIARGMIESAKVGQLAAAKYLFELAGLYPATEETEAVRVEDSLAHTLLRRMGLPIEPVISNSRRALAGLTEGAKAPRERARAVTEDTEREG
jgi:hypothetical protein